MMSGTTVVTVLMYRNMLICANSGDSRAVMFSSIYTSTPTGTMGESSSSSLWRATPLSRDHKPDDAEEASRIRAANGRVEQSKILPGMALAGVGNKALQSLAG